MSNKALGRCASSGSSCDINPSVSVSFTKKLMNTSVDLGLEWVTRVGTVLLSQLCFLANKSGSETVKAQSLFFTGNHVVGND